MLLPPSPPHSLPHSKKGSVDFREPPPRQHQGPSNLVAPPKRGTTFFATTTSNPGFRVLTYIRTYVQDGIANPGGTQLGMLGGTPAAPRPPPLLPPSAIRTDGYGRSYVRTSGWLVVRPSRVPSALHPCPRRCIRAL